ncbi:hypothetical protein B938_14540 [Bacillus velezensis AS43.3]|nr:hypothetical protein B938_14540 [Bacillus velezensis AS43.3]
MTKTIGLICGSLRKNSYNRAIAQSLIDFDNAAQFRWVEIDSLPFFNEDLEIAGAPDSVTSFRADIQDVDGVIIVSPEYNSGIPGVLKNALDWASRPRTSSVLNRKPVGLIGATPGVRYCLWSNANEGSTRSYASQCFALSKNADFASP